MCKIFKFYNYCILACRWYYFFQTILLNIFRIQLSTLVFHKIYTKKIISIKILLTKVFLKKKNCLCNLICNKKYNCTIFIKIYIFG